MIKVPVTEKNVFILLVVFLSMILITKIGFIFRIKVFKREYHFQNKIDKISKKFDLEIMPEIYNRLWLKLKKIDHVVVKINEKYERKRMINISYVIKRVLGEYDKTEADKIQLNLYEKTLKFYDEWYDNFKKTQ